MKQFINLFSTPMNISIISVFKNKKVVRCLCSDFDATKTSEILNLNRNTINRYFRIFRELIFEKQQ